MPRKYQITTEDVLVAAAQDLCQVKGATGKMLRILRAAWGATDTTLPTAQMCKSRCRFLPATVTDGSGGSVPTAAKNDPGDVAASFTALANNTGKATSSGTAVTLGEKGDHIYSGCEFVFRDPPVVGPSESFVFELLSTVSGTVHLSMQVDVEEIGG
jgi:hypothetical protein